jgi:lipid A 3-O-deacylase
MEMGEGMKIFGVLILLLASGSAIAAQDSSANPIQKGTWQLALFGGGGMGLGKSDNTQFFFMGGRAGRVFTSDHLSGIFRGNFEWDVDVMPIYVVFPPESAVYGGSIKPIIWKWNFTSRKKVVPYFAPEGGIVFTRENIPPGDTSQVNFTPGAAFGANVFVKEKRAFLFEVEFGHLSSASLGPHNPGYNGTFTFTVGYSWFHHS